MSDSHPLAALVGRRRRRVFVALLCLSLALMGGLGSLDRELRTEVAPRGMVSFELAGSPIAAQQIVSSWEPRARIAAAFSLGLDFLFLVVYSTGIAIGCLWVAEALERRGRTGRPGRGLAWGQWGAALLDAVENTALLASLLGPVVSPWPEVARLCALPKFALVGAGLAYVLGGGAAAAVTRSRPAA